MHQPRVRLPVMLFAAALSLAAAASNARADDCAGTPPQAVMELPQPLAKWGQIVCTPYGHIISNHVGWLWTNPGAYSPVFIPAQMVVENPAPTGNRSYFTKIELNEVTGQQYDAVYKIFHGEMGSDEKLPKAYRLDVYSIPGPPVAHLALYFFDYGKFANGMWCPHEKCDPASIFLILDMAHRPDGHDKPTGSP